jgi:uncharacterized protein with HEPN domain
MTHDDDVYLQHILDSIRRIEEYLQGINEAGFLQNFLIQDGVIRQLEIVGEATKQISREMRSEYGDIPWKDMAGMRDKLIHNYLGVDIEEVWYTVKHDIPFLKEAIEAIHRPFKKE